MKQTKSNLVEKPKKHITNKIVGVDVDGTLCKEVCWTPEECLKATPVVETINKVNKLYYSNIIIIYTARRTNLISSTIEWLEKNNVKFHAISNKKIPIGLYIDEDAIRPGELDEY